jgi:hypothetical protein
MEMRIGLLVLTIAGCPGGFSSRVTGAGDGVLGYAIADTRQLACSSASAAIDCPAMGEPFFGQDAQYAGRKPAYTKSVDGLTVLDKVTGLTWQHGPDTNGDGAITYDDKLDAARAAAYCRAINAGGYGGFNDWRLPSIKELYSLIDFQGTDPGPQATDTSGLTPFIDLSYFDFAYGQPAAGERIIDAQYASATSYVADAEQMFGVNFADGRIKAYPATLPAMKKYYVQCVRGDAAYGVNDFVDNGDQTITDKATGLTWTKYDSATPMDWEHALAWVQERNARKHLGYDDWRLPDAKELQSIVDYTRSPDGPAGSAAIAPPFTSTAIVNEGRQADYPWYWASTTHQGPSGPSEAVYVAFGRALGWVKLPPEATCYTLRDIHGAGAQRSDFKAGGNVPALGPACAGGMAYGLGPQGDVRRGANWVRLVRGGVATFRAGPGSLADGGGS